jgi:hypothetical protein
VLEISGRPPYLAEPPDMEGSPEKDRKLAQKNFSAFGENPGIKSNQRYLKFLNSESRSQNSEEEKSQKR